MLPFTRFPEVLQPASSFAYGLNRLQGRIQAPLEESISLDIGLETLVPPVLSDFQMDLTL